jgi:alpha-tubulin suppressor-like RCC1 family protein
LQLLDDAGGRLAIVGSNLVVRGAIDFETTTTLQIEVLADSGFAEGCCVTERFNITVADANDPPSEITLNCGGPLGCFVYDTSPANTLVGTLGAVDEDANQTHTFSIEGEAPYFLIDGDQLLLATHIDCEDTGPQLAVTVNATDSGSPAESVTTTVIIAVRRITAPHIPAASYPRWFQPTNATNLLFSTGAKAQCPQGCSVASWGGSGNGAVPEELSDPDIDSAVVLLASTASAFAAVRADGSATVWGDSNFGGANAPATVTNPAPGEEVIAIASTRAAFAALKADGSVVAWGYGDGGGDAPAELLSPREGQEVVFIAFTQNAFAAIHFNGSVSAWGGAANGGDAPSSLPGKVVAIASTESAFAALTADGAVVVWGDPTNGGAGVPEFDDYVTAIASTARAFAALQADGRVFAWGDSSAGGDLGDLLEDSTVPVVALFSTSVAFTALKEDGSVVAWGGDAPDVPAALSSPGDGAPTITTVTTSASAFAAILDDGTVLVWGTTDFGETNVPDEVRYGSEGAGGDRVVSITAAERAFAAVTASSAVYAWGGFRSGETDVPPELSSAQAVAISATSEAFAALTANGTVSAWGDSSYGGFGVPADATSPDAGRAVVAIAASENSFAVLQRIPCPAGRYTDSEGFCVKCPTGTFSEAVGATSSSTCEPCPAGTYSGELGVGNITMCVSCDAGKYSEALGANSSATCLPCGPGKYSSVIGADEESDCQLCPRGTYSGAQGATDSSTCQACAAGKYSEALGANSSATCLACGKGKYSVVLGADNPNICTNCGAGRYSEAEGADEEADCKACPAGTFSKDLGADEEADCQACEDGWHSSDGAAECEICTGGEGATPDHTQCRTCKAGEYSEDGLCLSCPVGQTSAAGSASAEACQSPVSSFVAGSVFLLVALVILCIYVLFGRAMRVAFLEQQKSTPILVQACTAASAAILTRMQRQRSTGLIWQLFLLMVTLIVLFVGSVMWFLTNTFLLSTSFLSPPDWMDRFEDALAKLIDDFPLVWFLVIVAPIMRWIRAIDFTVLMVGVQVTCHGAQAPVLLMTTGVIVIATILVIGSQFHAMAALAFVPMVSLVQMELLSASAPTLLVKAEHMFKFVLLTAVSAILMSCSRYVMQVFTTLVEYDAFLPQVEPSDACDDQGIDSLLAVMSTVVFYLCTVPVLLLMLRVMTPGLPAALRFPVPPKSVSLGSYRRVKNVLDQINPLKWLHRYASVPPR